MPSTVAMNDSSSDRNPSRSFSAVERPVGYFVSTTITLLGSSASLYFLKDGVPLALGLLLSFSIGLALWVLTVRAKGSRLLGKQVVISGPVRALLLATAVVLLVVGAYLLVVPAGA
jgi:hypothetical protein